MQKFGFCLQDLENLLPQNYSTEFLDIQMVAPPTLSAK